MAVGDIINGIATATGVFTYQPAVGVEVIVTSVFQFNGSATNVSLTNAGGVDMCYINSLLTAIILNTKIGLTNTVFLSLTANTLKAGFTGIQTK